MNTKLLALGAVTGLCCSGCATTLHSDGTTRAYYETPIVEESVIVTDSAPLVVDSSPIVMVERSRPMPFFPLLVSYRTHGSGYYHGPNHHNPPAPPKPVGPGHRPSVKPGHGHEFSHPTVPNKPQPKWPGGYGKQPWKPGGTGNKPIFPPKAQPNLSTKRPAEQMNNSKNDSNQHKPTPSSHFGPRGNHGNGQGSHFGGGGNHGFGQGSHSGGMNNHGFGQGSHFGGTGNHGTGHGGRPSGYGGHGGAGGSK